jgi:Mor family transcriptional regulator
MSTIQHDDILAYIVEETLRSALRDQPQRVQPEAERILPGLRQQLGGERYYIREQPKPLTTDDTRRRAIVSDAMTSMSTREIQQRHGVSRTTIYRLLKVHAKRS